MEIKKLNQPMDNLKIQNDNLQGNQLPTIKRSINKSINPENYYPNLNNSYNKNITYFATTEIPNTLRSDEYYNDEYYNDEYFNNDSSNSNSYSYSNFGTPVTSDYYYNNGDSSQSSINNMNGTRTKHVGQLKIQTDYKIHSRSHSSGSGIQLSPRNYNYERRGSQDTTDSLIFSPTSSNYSFSQSCASVNDSKTVSIKPDISSVTLQTLSFELASGWLSRITSAGFIKNNKKYYFVMNSEGLYYFKSNEPFARAKGFIKFDSKTKIKDIKENSSAKDKNSKIIELEVYKDNKSHQVVLQAEDPEDRDMWYRAIKKTIIRQKYINEALPPVPQTPKSGPGYSAYSPSNHCRSKSQSSRNGSISQSPSLSYTQQLRNTKQNLYHENKVETLPISMVSSLSVNDTKNILASQSRRRPSFDIQMLQQYQHQRTSSSSSMK
ncbi:PH-domain-containing protein [Neocallimastix lanati (nom. inval.)]|jgi:hypothetical protein|uniref:PH-domain-containing protein n=1 Tax=Neocallimastix californiae TaxID=1754190 RepID=A0A1Y2EPM9_9FUNG|nr:PH-domain-containing protein [Neocallimastix sp. JGI-2020a]ORY73543.1 PH-domain-containing protein [Neocallimastix californiae]|eukprot:ORY73543.1 PH-domain-containing protein [Neocallimastix californiae]